MQDRGGKQRLPEHCHIWGYHNRPFQCPALLKCSAEFQAGKIDPDKAEQGCPVRKEGPNIQSFPGTTMKHCNFCSGYVLLSVKERVGNEA